MFGIIIDFICLGIGVWGLYSRHKSLKRLIIVPGVITGAKSYQDKTSKGREITMYQAIVSFEFDGQQRTVTDKWASSIKPKIGKVRKVGINPNDIEDVRLYSNAALVFYWALIGFGILGILLEIL